MNYLRFVIETITKKLNKMRNQLTPDSILTKGEVLTLEKVKQLKGKLIAVTSREYAGNEMQVMQFTVGEVVSEWEKGRNEPYHNDKFKTYSEFWEASLKQVDIDGLKNHYRLYDAAGESSYCAIDIKNGRFAEPTFYGSDADRPIYFIEI